MKILDAELCSFFRIRKIRLSMIPVLMVEAYLLLVTASFVNAWSEIFFENGARDTLMEASGHFPAALLALCLAPAVAEELLFRGAVLRGFRNMGKGIFFSALIFALWHMNFNQMSYAFVAGLLLASMAVITDNLTCSMVTHFLFNLYNLLVVSFGKDTLAGRIMYYPEVIRQRLIPPLLTLDHKLIPRNFTQGLAVSAVSAFIYLFILYKAGPDHEGRQD